jgi:type II secretory pathway component PulF
MRRILMVLTVAVLMVTMMALSAVPSFAQVTADVEQEGEAAIAGFVGAGDECAGFLVCSPLALPMSG